MSTSVSRGVSGDGPAARDSAATDGVGELFGGGVLHDEARCSGLQRAAEVAGPAERRHDERSARGQRPCEGGGCGQAVGAGHLDVEQRDGRPGGPGGLEHLVTAGHLGDDLDVPLE